MKKRIIACTIIIAILYGVQAFAQDIEIAGISSVFYPNTGLKGSDNSAEVSFQEYGAFINIPYKFKNKKTVLVNGLGYGWIESSSSGLSFLETGKNKEQLQAIYYQLMFAHQLNNSWRLLINLRPTLASDFEHSLSADDFVLQGIGFALKKVNEHFSIGGGIAYTMRFGKPFAVPVLPLNYKKGKHNISALLPIKLTYKYSLDNKEKLSVGLKHIVNGAQFNIATPKIEKYHIPEIDKISYTRANIGATINYNITKFVQLELYGGASVRRQYNLLDKSNKTHEFNFKEAPFVQFGITLVPPKKKM